MRTQEKVCSLQEVGSQRRNCQFLDLRLSLHNYEKLISVTYKPPMLMVKNLIANAGDIRNLSSIPGSGRSSGGGNGNRLQYFCLENPMDREAWWASGHVIIVVQSLSRV